MKIVRLRTVFVYGVACLAGVLLLHTSQSVQQAEDQLAKLNESIQGEKESIQILNAEWAYLNNPERLEKLSEKYLKLMPPAPFAMTSNSSELPTPDPNLAIAEQSSGDPKIQPASFQPPTPSRKPVPPAKKITQKQDFSSLVKRVAKGAGQ